VDAGYIALALTAPLALLGVHRAALLVAWATARRADPAPPPLADPLPFVTVQLPVRDEPQVVARLVDAAAALDWPTDRLELQLLDDSDDDTPERAAPALARAQARGIPVRHLRRATRTGFKAGALAEGLACARGDILVILDADFVPAPELLRRLVPWLAPGDGSTPADMVQARWTHHREDGPLRAAQALSLDAHFLIERIARARTTGWFAFNGTAGAWRRDAIAHAGGWQGDTLTEDMDLSYRALLTGAEAGTPARYVYLREVAVPGELPGTMDALISQQRRWAKGTVEVLRKLGWRTLRAPVAWSARSGVLAHLLAPLGWPAGLLAQVAMPVLAWLPAARPDATPAVPAWSWGGALALTLGTQAAWLAVAGAARARVDTCATHETQATHGSDVSHPRTQVSPTRGALRGLATMPLVAALGAGLCWQVSLAVAEGLRGRRSPFVRTPKSGADGDPAPRQGRAGPPQAVPAAHASGASGARPERPDGGIAAGAPEAVLACWAALGAVGLVVNGHAPWALLVAPTIAGNAWVALRGRRNR
jgi:hypothetical protein